MDYFLQIYGTLPRAGPGSNDLTRQALELIASRLADRPRILDVGCGPGMQTLELLRQTKGRVLALDFLPQMLARVQAAADSAGYSDRLETLQLDMKDMSFPNGSFDVVWSEGAIYFLGFEKGLATVKPFVKPGGFVAVSEAVWLKRNPPSELEAFWAEYPEIDFVDAKLAVAEGLGYEVVGHFVFPPRAWREHYYDPMQERIAEKSREWKGNCEAESVLEQARDEIAVFTKYQDYYSYAFFVLHKPPA